MTSFFQFFVTLAKMVSVLQNTYDQSDDTINQHLLSINIVGVSFNSYHAWNSFQWVSTPKLLRVHVFFQKNLHLWG